MGPSARRFVLGCLLPLLASGGLAMDGWGPWPDTRFVPEPSPGWSFEELKRSWRPIRGYDSDELGIHLDVIDKSPRQYRVGDPVVVYFRNMDGSLQGLAGRGEVTTVDKRRESARVTVRLAHATEYWSHDPWKGWVRRHSWRPGFAPGEVSYYVSRENLSAEGPEDFAALLRGELYRGMSARNLMRTLGSPTSRGAYDFAEGRQEQWVYHLGPHRRRYVYVDVGTRRVTGWHQTP